jgi:HSP20 family protein
MPNEPQIWSPLRELDRFRRDFDDLFDRLLGGRIGSVFSKGADFPALESLIQDDKLVVRADLPGVDPKDVEVTVAGDTLTLRGKREQRSEESRANFIHREVSYGTFERSLKLPEGVKADDVKASYRNGILELTIPMPKDSAARKVQIQVEGPSKERS